MTQTTIKVKGETKKLLDLVKRYDNQSYDELIRGMIEEKLEEHLELRKELKAQILKAAEDIRLRRVRTLSFDELYENLYGTKY
ncbi:hypothetical protein HYV82_06590 [Candidatus Woesearchaeota archaeon]|nr:hypothetical protein [Candidatus Woesearchaeota archaeon]